MVEIFHQKRTTPDGKGWPQWIFVLFRALVKPFPIVWWAISLSTSLSKTYKGSTCMSLVLPKALIYINHSWEKYLTTMKRFVVASLENVGVFL